MTRRAQLRRLKVVNFSSFVAETTIDLPEHGVVLINGVNTDTKGSSGSGKSSLALAVPYVLGYSPVPGTQLQNWEGGALKVTLEMDTAEGCAVLTRGGAGANLTVGKEKVRGGAAAVEKRLSELHGLQPFFLEVMTYRRQKKAGVFLSLEPAKKMRFLTKLLDLERFEEQAEAAVKEGNRLEARCGALAEARERAAVQVEAARTAARPAELEDDAAALVAIQNVEGQRPAILTRFEEARAQAVAAALAERATRAAIEPTGEPPVLAELREQLSSCRGRLDQARERDLAAALVHRSVRDVAGAELGRTHREMAALGDPRRRESQACETLELVRAKECPTCRQTWVGDNAKEEIQRLRAAIDLAQNDAQKLQKLRDRLPGITAQALAERAPEPVLARLEAIERYLAAQLSAQEDGAAELAQAREAEAFAGLAQRTAEARGALDAAHAAQAQLDAAETEVRAHLQQIRTRNAGESARAQAERDALDLAVAGAAEATRLLEEELARMSEERDLATMLREFLRAIVEEVLQDISLRASSMMSSIPNVAHCSINLKVGEKRGIVPTINMGEDRPLESCSGGMTTSIELAVDLAVSSVLKERTAAQPTWLILDEPFDGLDQVSKEACLELLRDSAEAEGKLVLVIDHGSELKEMFEQVVTVTYSGGRSSIEAL